MSAEKKPCKGILKQSSSFDKEGQLSRTGDKEMKWDEMNILATYHPADKDYGHKKIDEPPTPYNRANSESEGEGDEDATLDAESLAARLGSETVHPKVMTKDESSEDEEEELTEEEKEKKRAFVKRRKMHYNEFQAVKLARQLIENEEDDDDAGGGDGSDSQVTGDQSQPPDESISSEATADSVQATGDSEAAGQMSTEDFV